MPLGSGRERGFKVHQLFGNGNGVIGADGLFVLSGLDNSPATGDAYQGAYSSLSWAGVPLLVKFFFQLAFAGTAATIVSGAVAERIKFVGFLVFSLLLVGIAYPLTGHWIWGGGWLAKLGFWDFAGSTVVHSVGGWAALMGAALLGSRIGKYNSDGSINAIPGHNLSIATLGCLILWLGWFGFNPGSTMGVNWLIGHIAMTTNIAAAFGGAAATIVAWVVHGDQRHSSRSGGGDSFLCLHSSMGGSRDRGNWWSLSGLLGAVL